MNETTIPEPLAFLLTSYRTARQVELRHFFEQIAAIHSNNTSAELLEIRKQFGEETEAYITNALQSLGVSGA